MEQTGTEAVLHSGARRYQTGTWETWDASAWSEKLLDWFFLIGAKTEPVEDLDVTDAGLARCLDEPIQLGDRIKQRIVDIACRASKGDLFEHAAVKGSDPSNWFVFLVVSVIAAVDTENPDERSFIHRLKEIAPDAASDSSLRLLPTLWQDLTLWLEKQDDYRPLVLPHVGALTRIGHSVRLAFPTRRDLIKLSDLFDTNELYSDNSLSAIMKPVRGMTELSDRLSAELQYFDGRFDDGASLEELHGTKFWGVVLDAFDTPSLDPDRSGSSARWGVVGGFVTENGPEFDLVTDSSSSPAALRLEPVSDLGDWKHLVSSVNGSDLFPAVLRREVTGLGRLDRLVIDGFIPMAEAESSGERESVGRSRLDEADTAVVSGLLLDQMRLCVDMDHWRIEPIAGTDWSYVSGIEPGGWVDVGSSMQDTDLALLSPAPRPRQIRVFGGVRTGTNRYLAVPGRHLQVRAKWADRCEVRVEGGLWEELERGSDSWLLTVEAGTVELRASAEGVVRLRQVTLVHQISRSEPRQLNDAATYWKEGPACTVKSSAGEGAAVSVPVVGVDRATYLSADVGLYSADIRDAAWELIDFGNTTLGRSLPNPGMPEARAASDGARRRWRRTLGRAVFDPNDPGLGIRGPILAGASRDKALPVRDGIEAPKQVGPGGQTTQLPGVDALESAVVGLSNSKIGLSRAEFGGLASQLFNLDFEATWNVQLDWVEAGLLLPLSSTRWSTRLLLAQPPRLALFETESWFGATLTGLSTPAMRTDLEQLADETGVLVERVASLSPHVPATLAMRSRSLDLLEQTAARAKIETQELSQPAVLLEGSMDVGRQPPAGYEKSGSEFEFEESPGVAIQFMKRTSAAAFWLVRAEGLTTWSHSRSAARFWASALSGDPVAEAVGNEIQSVAPLPLPFVGWLNALGAERPSLKDGRRCYPAITRQLAGATVETIREQTERAVESLRAQTTDGATK